MNILHLTGHSLVRFTPARIACYWGRYTEHHGDCVCLGRVGGPQIWHYKETLNPFGLANVKDHKDILRELVDRAQVIHCHDDCYPSQVVNCDKTDKVLVYHAHIGDIPVRFFKRKVFRYHPRVKHAVITNGYGRLFDVEEQRARVKWGRLADIIDIHHPIFSPRPETRPTNRFRVTFTFSNVYEQGHRINAKCPAATREVLKPVQGVEFRFVHNKPFEVAQAEKQSAHLVLDEIFSPYTHLSVLEGAAVGACVLANFDDYTRNELCDYLGAPRDSYPFVHVTPKTVVQKIEYFRDHPDEAIKIGQQSRAWMEKWHKTEDLLQKYLAFYGC